MKISAWEKEKKRGPIWFALTEVIVYIQKYNLTTVLYNLSLKYNISLGFTDGVERINNPSDWIYVVGSSKADATVGQLLVNLCKHVILFI